MGLRVEEHESKVGNMGPHDSPLPLFIGIRSRVPYYVTCI